MVVLGEITGTRENMGRSKKTILNIDIGGTKIRANFGGKLQKWNTPRTKKEFAKILEKLPRADAVGIGVAGVISGTRVIKSPNIRYLKNFDFREIFPKVVLRIDNDARVFLGERIGRFGGRRISRVIKSPNIRYLKNFDFREIFPKVVLRIDNDARVFLGERIGRFGGRRILV